MIESLYKDECMPISPNQFLDCLAASGLMARDDIRRLLTELTPHQRSDAAELARELVRREHLTRYQAAKLYQGKSKGFVLGNYVILDKIGGGGMGVVFRARHQRMDRVVAIKVLLPEVAKNDEAVKRFQREVKAAARLSHPNIVTAHDADQDGDVYFLVMEFVQGTDLFTMVKANGPLAVAKAVDYMLQAARGLEYAHANGVIHRDIKPNNLLLDQQGIVKILDMGLVRFESTVGGGDGTEMRSLTISGQKLGTVDYMAPEQARNAKDADRRSDIYSLGCTLHYVLTGQPIYTGATEMQRILAHRTFPVPSLKPIRADVPDSLDAAFQRICAKRPDDRFQTMTEVIAALHV
jgi:serine/threonine protein kinase